MKILLINPPLSFYKLRLERATRNEPLGLAYLAAYIRECGYEVKILDTLAVGPNTPREDGNYFLYGLSNDEIKKQVQEYNPDIVGITSMYTMHSKAVHDVARAVKEANPKIFVVVGGSHASVLPDWVLQDKNIDMITAGEGEETFMDIIKHVEGGKNLSSILGTVIRKEDGIKINEPRPFIKDIDSLPLPARDLLPMEVYLHDWYRTNMAMRPPRANITSSRGCLFNCVFCSIHSIWHHTWRGRDPVKVVDEIEMLTKKYGAREIAFQDDNVSLNRDRMEKICDGIIERKLKIRWCTPNGIAIWSLDEPLIDKMKKSGCYKLTFGIETGCPETQKFIRKTQVDLEKAKKIIKHCNKIGLWTHSPFIIGFPYETKENIVETINYAINSDLDLATFFIATPYPGTDLNKIFEKEGMLPPKEKLFEWMAATDKASSNTKYLTSEQIQALRAEAHRRFYSSTKKRFMNPTRLLRKIHSVEDMRYAMRLFKLSGGVLSKLSE